MGAQVALRPDRLLVAPGGEAHIEISVKNTGPVVDSFAFSVLGEPAPWAVCEPDAISLFPGQDGTAQVLLRPPVTSDLPYGPVPFAVRVASNEDPPGSVVQEGILEIAPLSVVTADMSPRTGWARGKRASRHRVAVDNRGNAPLVVEFVGCDEADTAKVQVRPPVLEVPPGSAAFAQVHVRARHRFWHGPAVTHRFQVITHSRGGNAVRSDGTLLQEAVLPNWLPKATALVAAAAVIVAALWLGVVRPVVKNAAANAAVLAAQTAAQTAAQQAAQKAAQNAVLQEIKKIRSSSPTPPPVPKKPSLPAPIPFAQTLYAGNPTLSAPPQHALAITDLVMQNPQADQGTLTLSLSGVVLFSEQLADFRDYDLHFITAIMVPTGQSFTFAVSCANPKPKPKPCKPVVLITGMNDTIAH
jgi:hypothetical protein